MTASDEEAGAPSRFAGGRAWWSRHRQGVLLAGTVALAAGFLGEHYGAPAMLFALLIGMAFNFLAADERAGPGIVFCSKTLLRIGVALLGVRLTFEDVARLGWTPTIGVVTMLMLTLGGGVLIARAFGRGSAFGLLTGGAVGICGASAALALAAVLPSRLIGERDVLFTVVGVTTLSTVAMVIYPALFGALGLDDTSIGYLIGATVHDVAQVVGAGYSVSVEAGDIATFTKLQRIALLPVVLLVVAFAYRAEGGKRVGLPWFVVAFTALMIARNTLPAPEWLIEAANTTSRAMLLTAIAALGVRTSLAEMRAAGAKGVLVIACETLALLAMALLFAFAFLH